MIQSIQIKKVGGPQVLEMIEEPSPPLQLTGVRIKVTAIGVNFADLMMRMGLYPEAPQTPFVPGYEVAGIVIETGGAVKSFHPGDRVMAGTRFGGYRTEIVLPEYQVKKIPGTLTDIEAAAVPVNFLTAWIALQEMARIRKGDRVLIQNAAGGVGIAAIQIALKEGAEIVGLVGSQAKVAPLRTLGISEVYTYEQWETSDNDKVKRFQVIMDSSGGQSLKQNFQYLAPGGRMISYGVANMVSSPKRSMTKVLSHLISTPFFTPYGLMMGNKGIYGLNLLKFFDEPVSEESDLLQTAFNHIIDQFNQESYKVWIGKTFPLAQVAAAHTYLQSRVNIGKVILIPPAKPT